MAGVNISIVKKYDEELRANLLSQLKDYGTSIEFSANTWICDKKKKGPGYEHYTWYFSKIPEKYRDIVKYYAINDKGIQASTMDIRIGYLRTFFQYLQESCAGIELMLVDGKIVNNFQLFLQDRPKTDKWKANVWSGLKKFFEIMTGWTELPKFMPANLANNPWLPLSNNQRHDEKLVPDIVAEQLDRVFYDNRNIPVTHRLLYWLLRLIPSRGCEPSSMSYDCIKPIGDNRWVLTIPTWKQNGGYQEAELRMIYLVKEGIIEYLLEMIKQQQEITTRYQAEIPNEDKILFKVGQYKLNHWAMKKGEERYNISKSPVAVNTAYITRMLQTYCTRFNIQYEDGNLYKVTSHQFRHNGITERIDEGWNIIEIRDMTGHKGDQMIRWGYFHPNKDKQIQIQKEVNKALHPSNQDQKQLPIMFRGRIMNLDSATEQRLLRNPRAYKLRIGICSDITTCKSKIFECLACDYFVPKVEDLDYWEERTKYWSAKVETAKKRGFTEENAEYNLALHRAILKRILAVLEEMDACAEKTAK